jgi:drug/metabolite transporter (DMT)-like permease
MFRPMTKVLLSMIVAFSGYSLLNIAQACQKIGLGVMERSRLRGTIVWVVATFATTASSFVVLYAVSIGSVSLVGAMAGTGLASLSLFSAFVMRERIRGRELAGIGVVLGAAVLVGLFSKEMGSETGSVIWLLAFLGGVAVIGALSILFLLLRGKPTGVAVGCLAGALGGFIPLFQKISTSELGRQSSLINTALGPEPFEGAAGGGRIRRAGEIFANPYSAAWIALSVVSMIVLQFALKKEKAIRIIPSFTASIVLLPVIGGTLFFNERLAAFQVAGVVLILGGMLLITQRRGSPASRAGEPCA